MTKKKSKTVEPVVTASADRVIVEANGRDRSKPQFAIVVNGQITAYYNSFEAAKKDLA